MIKWEEIYKLEADEFSEDPDKYAEPDLIYALSDVRLAIRELMRPSPINGALARFGGSETSQHYVGDRESPKRLSTASDMFIEGIPFHHLATILSLNSFKGIGIYLDTKGPDGLSWIMFHLDIRSDGFSQHEPLLWIVEKVFDPSKNELVDKYRYPQADPKYWSLLNDEKFYRNKQYGIG